MSKELEALEILRYPYKCCNDGSKLGKAYHTIYKALNQKEKLEKVVKLLNNFNMREAFGLDMTLEEFNESWLLNFTQEEFDLLKEVFEK